MVIDRKGKGFKEVKVIHIKNDYTCLCVPIQICSTYVNTHIHILKPCYISVR